MIILEYSLKNAGRIKAVSVKPKVAGVTTIGGRNRQGKTTNLDMLCWGLGGDKFRPVEPNRRGGDGPAEIDIRTDNGLRVQRKGKNGSLKVTDEATGTMGNQTLLDKFITTFALDLPAFRRARPQEKCDILLRTLGVDVEYAACESRIKEAYDHRTVVNRIAKQKEAALQQATKPPELPRPEPVKIDGLVTELRDVNAANTQTQRLSRDRDLLSKDIERDYDEIERLCARLAELREAARTKEDLFKAMPEPTALKPTDDLERQIAEANAVNAQYARIKSDRDNYERMAADVRAAQQVADDAEATVEQARKAKEDLLASVQMPDPDIGVADGTLTYRGDSWDQMADSDELILCCKIVSRLNPECRFVLVDGLERLDDTTLSDLDTWAASAELQIIGTRVTSDPNAASLIIEDGEIVTETRVPAVPAASQ
jgi:hypothetical protein